MLAGSRLVAFVATRRPFEAKAFYSDVVGLRLITDDSFALVFDAGGTILRIQKVAEVARRRTSPRAGTFATSAPCEIWPIEA